MPRYRDVSHNAHARWQKFFGSFFQERTACLLVLSTTLALSACVSNSADQPTGSPRLSNNGAGPYIGGSAGSSIGGGPLGAGTEDNRAGAK